MTDLHALLVSAIQDRLDRAVTAQRPFDDDAIVMSVWEDGFAAVRCGLEAEIERHCRADLERLHRHRLVDDHEDGDYLYCNGCRGYDPPWPCIEIQDLAGVYGVGPLAPIPPMPIDEPPPGEDRLEPPRFIYPIGVNLDEQEEPQ